MNPSEVSVAPGTKSVRSEVIQASECPLEINTGFTHDDRYHPLTQWKTSEADIMKENGVYEKLFNPEVV